MKHSRGHLPELDWLKGFAILAVICIHAKLYADSVFFLQIINRAVHVFLVLFGISSELWWQREETKRDVRPEDVTSTIYSALGIDYTKVRTDDPLGRGFEYVPYAKDGGYAPIEELW